MNLSLKYNILIMPKPYKKREFQYHFSQDDENTIFNFKKEFTMLLALLFPKDWKVKKWHYISILIIPICIIVIVILLLLNYFWIINFIWTK